MLYDYSEFFPVIIEVVGDRVLDYINYKRAQGISRKYQQKLTSGTSCGTANPLELEAIAIRSRHERNQENRINMKFRIKKIKKAA